MVDLTNGQVLVYQPQVNKWDGNQIDFRAALAIKVTGAKDETFGVIFATARTQVDKVARTVVFENMNISKIDFPTLPNRGAAYVPELQKEFSAKIRTIALDRLQSSLAIAGVKPPTVEVQNNPPQVLVSYSPAILVPIDGAPVMKPIPQHDRYQARHQYARAHRPGRVRQQLLHPRLRRLAVASSLAGPWSQASSGRSCERIRCRRADLAKAGTVDLLDGGPKANPKPSLANGVPAIYTSQVPTELIVFKGQPDFVPIVGTQLLWASNTTSDVLINTANNNYYALLAGRWFMAAASMGPGRSSRATSCRRTSRASRRNRSPAPCCRPSPARRRRRKRSSRIRSRRPRPCRSRTGRSSRRNSTDRRNSLPSPARRSRT